jgi:hypothetical protein
MTDPFFMCCIQGTKDFEAFRIALEAAESKSEVTPIKHYRKRTFFEARLQARGLVLEPELGECTT